MNKAELICEIQKLSGESCSRACAEQALNSVLQAIINGVEKTGSVQLVGFGTFSVVKRAARTGINPRTKEKINIPASTSVKFKVGAKFREIAK